MRWNLILLDVILFLIIFAYLFEGWRKGLVVSGLSLIGYIISAFISKKLSNKLTTYFIINTNILFFLEKHFTSWLKEIKNTYVLKLFDGLDMLLFSHTFINVFGFIILFWVISKAIGFLIKNLKEYLPFDFLDIVDRLIGSMFGMVRGFIMIFILLSLLVQLIEVDENYVLEKTIYDTYIVKNLYKNNPIIRLAEKMKWISKSILT